MKKLFVLFILILPYWSFSQQVADLNYNPKIGDKLYKSGEGPIVFIDEGHHNFHTKDGKYMAFSNLLERDGYNVRKYKGEFIEEELSKGKILVISNALNKINIRNWTLPNPSAFSKIEIEIVKKWVNSGGSLFLIADHMPMGGAAKDLAMEFGFEFTNGFAYKTKNNKRISGPSFFNLKNGSLTESIITKGRNSRESVDKIATFTGQAFKIPNDATPILTFGKNYVNLLPNKAWVFNKKTPTINVKGWSQGAYKKHGKGKIVVFGEAAMFSAQLAGPKKIKAGMNNKVAPQNYQLLLNIVHWLDGVIK